MDFAMPGLDRALPSTTISVNGKSDGNTVADYSNMVLTGVLPYLHAPRERDLDVAVVGLGTGLSSGAIAGCADVRSVTTLEISPGVIEAAPFFERANFGLLNNPKSHIVQADAFRFFARSGRKFDIIISEPSNVWVVGVENLFTPEFYALANNALNDDGVFFQWFQIYEMNTDILRAIAANVLDEFPYAALFAVGASDVGIMASRRPLQRTHAQRRLAEEHVLAALSPMGIDDLAMISLLEIYPSQHLAAVAFTDRQPRHSVEFPWIGHAAGKSRFLHERVRLGGPVMHDIGRHLPVPEHRRVDFAQWMSAHANDMSRWCSRDITTFAASVVCTWLQPNAEYWRSLMQQTTLENLGTKLDAYSRLRQQGFIGPDLAMLEDAARVVRQSAGSQPRDTISQAIGLIVLEYADEWQWEAAALTADSFRQSGALSEAELASLREQVLERGVRGRATAERLETGLAQRRLAADE
jgi:spermidine synthase